MKEIVTDIMHRTEDAEDALKTLRADVRLDLHKTLDTISEKEQLHPHNSELVSCCVSYVGRLTTTRIAARNDIISRIKAGQIVFGALVFNRGSHRDPELANNYTVDGSKAWFNRCVGYSQGVVPLFVDDSDDHVLSVKTLGNINSIQIRNQDSLLDLIKKHTKQDSNDTKRNRRVPRVVEYIKE